MLKVTIMNTTTGNGQEQTEAVVITRTVINQVMATVRTQKQERAQQVDNIKKVTD